MTMSFSLWAVVAKHSRKQTSQPQNWLRLGAEASAIHGRRGCSGCTPAAPYPPSRGNKPTKPARSNQPKKTMTAVDEATEMSRKECGRDSFSAPFQFKCGFE